MNYEESRKVHLNCGHSILRIDFQKITDGRCPICGQEVSQSTLNWFSSLFQPRAEQTFSNFAQDNTPTATYLSAKDKKILGIKDKSNCSNCVVQFGTKSARSALNKVNNEIKVIKKI